jgi:hypothetical protein
MGHRRAVYRQALAGVTLPEDPVRGRASWRDLQTVAGLEGKLEPDEVCDAGGVGNRA